MSAQIPASAAASAVGRPISTTHHRAEPVDDQDLASYRCAGTPDQQRARAIAGYNARWDVYPGNGGFGKHINIGDVAAIYSHHPGYVRW